MKRRCTSVCHSVRNLRIEGLEKRELLSLAPVITVPPRASVPVSVPVLTAMNRVVPSLTLGADDFGMIARIDLCTSLRAYARITDMAFVSAEGSDLLFGNADELLLKADLNGLSRDGCEATVAKTRPDPDSDLVDFHMVRPVWGRPGKTLRTEVYASMGNDLSGERIGVELAEVVARDLRGRLISDIRYTGAPPTLHTLEYAQAEMFVTELAGPSSDTAVSNQQGLVLGRVRVAAEGADLLFTGLHVEAQQGSLYNITRPEVWFDSDDNGFVDTIVSNGSISSNPLVVFDFVGGGVVIPEDTSGLFEVRATAALSLMPDPSLQITSTFASAEVLQTGQEVGFPRNIHLVHADQTLWSFDDHGSLTVSNDTTPVRSHQLLGGTGGVAVTRAALTAALEDSDVCYIGIRGDGQLRSIDRVAIKLPGQEMPISSATRYGAESDDDFGVRFTNRELVVAEGTQTIALLCPDILTDVNGGQSNDCFTLEISTVMARGVISGNTLQPVMDGPVVGPWQTVVMSKISAITNGGAATEAMPVGADREIGMFSCFAAANFNYTNAPNRAIPDTLTFVVDTVKVGINPSGFNLINTLNPTVSVAASTVEVTGSGYCVTFTGLAASAVDTAIGSGGSATFALRANITNPNTAVATGGSSSLQTTLRLRDGFFAWYDQDYGSSHRFDWLDYPDSEIQSTLYQG
ncbi:MAG: hypothetical protein PHO20_01235 [Candidatus Peribacteraceae bacterium]|nr:hypothetical protein [Candidatus Peribacteraceae bacterium]MDD5739371.1 hypothetical protein [Candidatus Peribacteraceae bacterium]